jgi:hypothetical protein
MYKCVRVAAGLTIVYSTTHTTDERTQTKEEEMRGLLPERKNKSSFVLPAEHKGTGMSSPSTITTETEERQRK